MAAEYFSDKEHSSPDVYFEEVSKPAECICVEMQTGTCTGPNKRLRGLMTERVE